MNHNPNYFFSAGFLSNEGAIVANSQKRYSFRSNIEHQTNHWLRVGANTSFTRNIFSNLNIVGNALSGNVVAASRLLPNVAVFNPQSTAFDGYNISPDGAALGLGNNLRPVENNFTNIAFILDKNKIMFCEL